MHWPRGESIAGSWIRFHQLALKTGTRLGPYEVLSPLGAGGMGEVYKARDTRLDRLVAIKILPESLAEDPVFRERFEREARTISQLDHSHICSLYDTGVHDGTSFLVMQYLDGETLSDRLTKGPLSAEDVFRYAGEIADALDKAHRLGIVHRDLKPGNVMITKAGAKLLDFGLAKTGGPALAFRGASMLPTTPPSLTAQGTILGTFQYMAPEQLEGRDADPRTDIFAFGALLYEMATGRRAFQGKTQVSLIGAILKDEPPPVSSVQPIAPQSLDRIVQRCLAKDPDDRWQTMRDVVVELRDAAKQPVTAVAAAPAATRPAKPPRLPWIIATVAIVGLIAAAVPLVLSLLRNPEDPAPVRFSIGPGEGVVLAPSQRPIISPDGRRLAFVAQAPGGQQNVLWVRPLDVPAAQILPGTENASVLFWSPDSRFVGFWVGAQLKKIDVSGGPPQTVTQAQRATPGVTGASWSRDNVIVFSSDGQGLYRVSAAGGTPIVVTTLDKSRGETIHSSPYFLPDGRHFLFLARTSNVGESTVSLASLDSSEVRPVLKANSEARYAPPGYLLYLRGTTLTAQSFDANRLALAGDPFAVAEQLVTVATTLGMFSVSNNGILVYRSGAIATRELVLFDRSGKQIEKLDPPAVYDSPAFSPDGRRIAVSILSSDAADIWIIDRARGLRQRFTFGGPLHDFPAWSADGERISFFVGSAGGGDIRRKLANGAGDEEVLLKGGLLAAEQVTQDGKWITFTASAGELTTSGSPDAWALPISGDGKPVPLVRTPFSEGQPRVSPNGKWFAYSSAESGRLEIFVQSFPTAGGKWQVSRNGGSTPRWRQDGKELFFIGPDRNILAAPVTTDGPFESGTPMPLFQARAATTTSGRNAYDVTADGKTFVVNSIASESGPAPINVVLNWASSLTRR